jgi:hypothetical protein
MRLCRWEDYIKLNLKEIGLEVMCELHYLTIEKDWRAIVNVALILQVI